MGQEKVITFFLLIMTTNSKPWDRKKAFSDKLFSEGALLEEQLVRQFGKTHNGGRSYQKKLDQKSWAQR